MVTFFEFNIMGLPNPIQFSHFVEMVATRIDELQTRPSCDPVRVFIKEEPASKNKRETGALRLISSVSIVDTVVHRLLFGKIL